MTAVGSYQTKIDALNAPPRTEQALTPAALQIPTTLSEPAREEGLRAVGASRQVHAKDDVLAKTSSELVRAHDAYDKAYEDSAEAGGGPAITSSTTLTLEKIEENEGCKPVQPAYPPSTISATLWAYRACRPCHQAGRPTRAAR